MSVPPITHAAPPPLPEAVGRRGFRWMMIGQGVSGIADNAVLIIAIALLDAREAPAWMTPFLKFAFIASYVAFAFVVGALAERWARRSVIGATHVLKALACAGLWLDLHPLLAYAAIGLASATYSPAKVALLLELVPSARLVRANAAMEGLTIATIVGGTLLGGMLVSAEFAAAVGAAAARAPGALDAAVGVVIALYALALVTTRLLPDSGRRQRRASVTVPALVRQFNGAFAGVLHDPAARVALCAVSLIWGVGAVLQFVIIDWGRTGLGLTLDRASMLQGVVAAGVAIGAVAAARFVTLERTLAVVPIGLLLGPLVVGLLPLHSVVPAAALLAGVGVIAGSFIVPMNALLQHRGHQLGRAGQTIAVQNFCENASVMAMLGVYAALRGAGLGTHGTVVAFAALTTVGMVGIAWQRRIGVGRASPNTRASPVSN